MSIGFNKSRLCLLCHFLNEIPQCTKREEKSASFTDTLASKETQRSKAAKVSYQSHNFCQFQSKAILLAQKCNFLELRKKKFTTKTHFSNEIFDASWIFFGMKKKLVSYNCSIFFSFLFQNFLKFHFGVSSLAYLHIIIYLIFVAFWWELWIVSTKLHPPFCSHREFFLSFQRRQETVLSKHS